MPISAPSGLETDVRATLDTRLRRDNNLASFAWRSRGGWGGEEEEEEEEEEEDEERGRREERIG